MKKIIIPIIILLLLGGGFYAYKYVYVPTQEAKYDVEETTEVETKEVATIPYGEPTGVLNVMENTNAIFFEFDDTGEEIVVSQMSKRDYSKTFKDYKENIKLGEKGIEHFFNLDASTIKGSIYENINGSNPLIGKGLLSSNTEEGIRNIFDDYGGITEYFEKHNLEISCEDISVVKTGSELPSVKYPQSYTIYKVVVKTDNCTGDMSDLGMFEEKGNSKTIFVSLLQDLQDNSFGFMYFKY